MEKQKDLFEFYLELPKEVQKIISTFEDETYEECRRLEKELLPHGYKFDWGLDAQPFNLRKFNYITEEDLMGLNVLGYTPSMCGLSGSLSWFNPNTKIEVWATPNWEDEDGFVPFDYDISDGYGDVRHATELRLDDRMSKDQQVSVYVVTLNAVIQLAHAHSIHESMKENLDSKK